MTRRAEDLFHQLPCPALVTDLAGGILVCNAKLLTLISGSTSQISRLDDILTPAGRIFLQTHVWPMILRDGQVEEIYLHLMVPLRAPIPVLVNGCKGQLDGEACYQWVFFVAQERSRFEAELLAANARTQLVAAELAEKHELLQVTMRSIGDGVITTDAAGRVTWLNPVAEQLTGWPVGDAAGVPIAEVFRVIDQETRAPAECPVTASLLKGVAIELAANTLLVARDGQEHGIEDSAAPIRHGGDGVLGVVLVFRDVTTQRETKAQLGMLAEHSGVVVMLSDLDGTRRYVSPSAERVLGWRSEDLVGRNARDYIHPEDHQLLQDANDRLKQGATQSSATYRFRRPDESWVWIDGHASLRTQAPSQAPTDYVVVLRDATERKAAELKLLEALNLMEQMAATDGLTGLANRRQLDVEAVREWRRCARERLPLSALLVDADRFKLFNDRYGHLAGDDCLRAIGAEIAAAAQRPGDVAGRYGGEEFLLLLPATDNSDALVLAKRLCQQIQQLGIAHGSNAGFGVVTVSIGVATAWPQGPKSKFSDLLGLFNAADAALYRAKSTGRNKVAVD